MAFGNSTLGTGAGAVVGGSIGGPIGGAIGGFIGKKLFGKNKGPNPYEVMYMLSANKYNKYKNNAKDLLSNDSDIATSQNSDNSDLLQGYYDYLGNQYNKNSLGFFNANENNLYNNYKNDLTNQQKSAWQRDFNDMFKGYGTTNDYLDDLWSMNSAKDFNADYLNDYYNDTKTKLDSAKSRGLLNDAGYNSALNTLNQRNSAASSGVRELTDSVLNNYRDDWTNLAGNIQTGIDNYNLGQRNMNLGEQWNNQYNDLYGRQQQNFEGDMYNALSGYTPYNVSDILANARNTQGVINPQATEDSDLLSALREKESKKNKVGLGNQGIF